MMDVVSSQYGWPDEHILSLTYARFKQITKVIAERQQAESVMRHSYAQLFYDLLALLPSWKGDPPRLGDIFASATPSEASTEQFRTDLWWKASSN